MSSGCMIIFRDSQNKKNLSCLCKTGGEPAKAGKILYMCYGEGKLDALFEGHNKACEKIESRIEKVIFLPVTENNNVAIGWIYKFDGGNWYVAEAQDGFYKPLEEEFTDEKDVAAIKQFLRTNHLPVKEQIDELKKNEGAPIGESDEMEEISISLDDKAWRTIDALCEDLECTSEELIRYILLSYVARDYIGEEMPNVTDFHDYLEDDEEKEGELTD